MLEPGLLTEGFDRNTWVIKAQTEGLSHADSLLQTPYQINCLNWTLGHLLDGRGRVLDLLGIERPVPAEETERYARESEPVLGDGPGVLQFDRLLEALEESGARISAALAELAAEDLAAVVGEGESQAALGARLHFAYFHDTYHTGQTELLRQVAGVGDKVI
jgi:uncharacterized damage-inducible protein DinB